MSVVEHFLWVVELPTEFSSRVVPSYNLSYNYRFVFSGMNRTTKGYPLIIRPTTVIIEEASEVDAEMIRQILPKIDYTALKQAYGQIHDVVLATATTNHPNLLPYLPSTLPDEIPNEVLLPKPQQQHMDSHEDDKVGETDDTKISNQDETSERQQVLYKTLFCALFEIHVMEGTLICPDTEREFPIKDGIPNMILHEDEL